MAVAVAVGVGSGVEVGIGVAEATRGKNAVGVLLAEAGSTASNAGMGASPTATGWPQLTARIDRKPIRARKGKYLNNGLIEKPLFLILEQIFKIIPDYYDPLWHI